MKKVRFLWFGALLVLAGMLFAGCEKAQEEKISINTKDAIKLDLFQSQEEGSEEDWENEDPKASKLILQGQFEPPYHGYCSDRELLMKKGRSIAEQASEIENLVARHKWINGYDIPEVAEDQELLQFDITNLMITKYPLVIKGYYTSGKELGFINLKTEKQGNDLVILGPKVSTGDSYFYVDAEEQGIDEFKFENLNQDIKQREDRERREARYFATALHFHFRRLLVKIFQRGERFDRIVFHYPLGEVTLQLPAWRYDGGNCEVEFDAYRVFTESPLRVVASGVDYKLDFHPVISGAVIKSARLLQLSEKQASGYQSLEALKASLGEKQVLIGKLPFNYQGFADRTQNDLTDKTASDLFRFKFFKEWTATVKAGVPSQVAFTIPEEGNYLLLVENDNGQLYAFNFTPRAENAHAVVKNDKEAMTLTIVHDWLLTGQGLSGQLDRILGSGNYTLEVSSLKEARFPSKYGGVYREEGKEYYPEGQYVKISYFIAPNKHYTGNLEILDLDGKKYSHAVDFFVEKIGDARVSRDLFSQKLNVLPSEGYRADKIKVGSKNARELKIYTQVCEVKQEGDFSDAKRKELLPPRKSHNEYDDYDSRTTLGELHFFDCKGKIEEHTVPVEKFEYRKRIDRERELPASVKTVPYFRMSFDKGMKDAKYYMRSPVGLFAKVAPYQELLIRGVNFADGAAVQQGELQIFDDKGKLLKKDQLGASGYVFSLSGISSEYFFVRYQDKQKKADTFLIATVDGRTDFNEKRAISASWLMPEQTDQQEDWYERRESLKIYGYTDRGLYRPGDTVHFAGFVQDVAKVAKAGTNGVQTGFVIVEITDYESDDNKKIVLSKLDEFGGFEGSFTLNESSPLRYYHINFHYALDKDKMSVEDFGGDWEARENYRKTHPVLSYWSDFHVDEFQKQTFSVQVKKEIKDKQLYLELTPSYYMGGALKDYDLHLTYSLAANQSCSDCRWRERSDYYYNYVADSSFSRGGSYEKEHLTGGAVLFQMGDLEKLPYKGEKLKLQVQAYVKDNLSDETRMSVEYLDIDPEVKIGLNGYAYDWIDSSSLKNYRLTSRIESNLNKVAELSYEWYFRPFGFEQSVDTEGTFYYINGSKLQLVQSGTLQPKSEVSIPLLFERYQGGEYFLRVVSKDKHGVVNGEVDKNIYYYDSKFDKGFQGDMENNYALHVQIPKKNYEIGENIPISINPYIKGATALLTVERGNQILEKRLVRLDGKPLTLTAKEEFYPNVQVSVTEFVGEQVNSQLGGSGEQKRKEPAFFAGYAEALIQEKLKDITIKMETDKAEYQPGEKVKLKIFTTDYQGKPLTARVSLSVVDKALSDLYDLIKDPIPYFYNRIGSSIGNFGNWKNLYYALRTFFADGEKGGGGMDGTLKNLRKKFYDLAFRDAAIITTGGKAELSFTLPDNLTTWMLDAVAVSRQSQLGTSRAYFRVNQPLVVEANLPTFLTIGDQITLPLKLVASPAKLAPGTEATLKGVVKDEAGTVLQSFEQKGKVNEKFGIQISVGEQFFDQQWVTIEVEAKAGNFHDAAQWKIPVRTEGLVNKSFSLEQQRSGERLFTFDDEVVRGKLVARLAPFPNSVLAEPLHYLLFYSPKGPSEWLVKTAQTALEAESLTKAGLLTGDLVQSGVIRLAEGKKMAISELLTAVLFQLKGRQDWDGGIKEQDRSDYPSRFWEQKNTSSLLTSISTYALLETMKTNGYANLVPKDFSERLERYLAKLGSDSPELYLYYLAQRKTNLASINTALVSQLQKKYPNNIAIQALSFYLLAQNAGEADAIRLAQSVEKLFEQAFAQGRYFEGVPLTSFEGLTPELAALAEVAGDRNTHLSLDLKALQGFYLRGVLKLHTRFPKQEHFTNQISSQILSLLKSRSAYGLWSWSSTTNFAVLTALNAALTSYYQHQSQTTHCVLQVGNTKLELDAGKTCVEKSIPFEHTKDLKVQRSCEGPAFLDLQVNSLLKDITKKKTELHNVEKLTFEYPATAQIGEKIPLKAGFKTLKEAQNLTVEFTIPSRFKFWSNLQVAENSFEKGVFDFGNDRACFPDFYEFRFDRVILNYGTMKAGKECNFTFYAVNAFDGQFVYPPSKLYEQQATQVWGSSKVIRK